MSKLSFGIIGSGAWGSAFARLLRDNGSKVLMWDRKPDSSEVATIGDLRGCDVLVVVLPFQALRGFLASHMERAEKRPMLLLAKGIEIETMKLGHQVFAEILPNAEFAVLSGPNFASEIARGLPAATMIAGKNAEALKAAVAGDTMRVYTSADVIGVEVCGAIKNVIAIAAGITVGGGYGENAKAALICRSLAEIERLVRAMGGADETVFSLAGIGDLMLTCGSATSRNFAFGLEIGKAGALGSLLSQNTKTIEGVHTAHAIYALMQSQNLDMPICAEVYQILFEDKLIAESLKALMSRGK